MPILKFQYSKAFFEQALEDGIVETVYFDLNNIIIPSFKCSELTAFLSFPHLNFQSKFVVLKDLFCGKISELSFNFLIVIIQSKREREILIILNECIKLLEKKLGIHRVLFITAVEVSSILKEDLKKLVKDSIKCESIILSHLVDASIIGGYKVLVDGKQIDFSIKSGLKRVSKLILNKN